MTDHATSPHALCAVSLTPDDGLPAPFRGLAALRADATATLAFEAPHLRYAWAELRHPDGVTQPAGALWVTPMSTGWLADAPLPPAGAGLLVAADGLPPVGPLAEPPRALSPGIDLRLLAGSGFGRESAVLADFHCALAVVRLARMMRFEFRPEHATRMVLVAAGTVSCGGQTLGAGQHLRQDDARTFYIEALEASVLVLLAGTA